MPSRVRCAGLRPPLTAPKTPLRLRLAKRPCILDPSHNIVAEERRYVHVHPITGYVLLHELSGFPPAAAQAILQHHERLDGSGYPHALAACRIVPLARLLAVADVAEAVIKRFDLSRVDMLFRINQFRFDPAIVSAMRDLLHVMADDVRSLHDEGDAASRLAHLADLLHAWSNLRTLLEQQLEPRDAGTSSLAFLFDRMATIRSLVLQAGFDPDNMTSMLSIAHDDTEVQQELRAMLDEMDWLLLDLAYEIDRRSPELTGLWQDTLKGLLGQLRHLVPAVDAH